MYVKHNTSTHFNENRTISLRNFKHYHRNCGSLNFCVE